MHKDQINGYGTISEMSANPDDLAAQVPFAPGVELTDLTEGDDKPVFVTLEAITPGVSNNKRRYSLAEVNSIAKQVNKLKPNGYLGHLTKDEKMTKYPEPAIIWVGAAVLTHEGKQRLFIKGYVLPTVPKFRTYLKKAKATGTNVAVSIFGKAFQVWNAQDKVYDVSEFDLESIDVARHLSEGMSNSGLMQLTAEMTNNQEETMTREEVLTSTTASELREHNPALAEELASEFKSQVQEMTEATGAADVEAAKTVIAEMQSNLETAHRTIAESIIDKEINGNVAVVAVRQGLKKMALAEMTDTEPEAVKTLVSEMLQREDAKALIESATPSIIAGGGGTNNRGTETPANKWITGKDK